MNALRKTLQGYTSEAEIDTRIKWIENKMAHESISLKDEKNFMIELKDLKKLKPKLAQMGSLKGNIDNFDAGTDLKAKKNELNEQFSILFEKKKAISEKFKVLQDKRTEREGDLGSVREEKD